MRKFAHHKYTWSNPFGSPRHHWELVGPNGAIHFHVSLTKGYDPSCGLEFHHLSGDGAPHHLNCPLTGGRCWHDGTSLYASETVWPVVSAYLQTGDHEQIFRYLEGEYEARFETGSLRTACDAINDIRKDLAKIEAQS
jgi:hypothetical protein